MGSRNPSLLEVSPVEDEEGNGGEEEEEEEEEEGKGLKWWNTHVLDLKEAKTQIVFSLPMILTNVFYYLIPLVSVMFAGHLGELELAGATLANSWATVTGFAFMIGSSGALETLCGQAFGAKCYRNLGLYLQASCLISFFFSILISVLWFYTEPVLIILHQDPKISKKAGLYMKFLIPGLVAYGFLQNIVRFLQTQSKVMPLLIFSALPLVAHIAIAYLLVNFSSMGFEGASLAASVTIWIAFLVLLIYLLKSKKFEHTWDGFSIESFQYVFTNLKLALPSAAMVCLEYWAFEILVLLAGLMPNPETTTSLIAMCVNTEAISYMSTFGLSAAASTRVSNEMGAGNLKQAKAAMAVTLKLSLFLAFAIVVALGLGHNIWASLFSSSHVIIEAFASMTPFLVVSIIFDSIQGILSGAARGCGWQHFAMYINLVTFYVVGMTIAAVLGFKFKLHAKGLWVGLICGLFCQTISLAIVMWRGKWKKIDLYENAIGNDDARKPLV